MAIPCVVVENGCDCLASTRLRKAAVSLAGVARQAIRALLQLLLRTRGEHGDGHRRAVGIGFPRAQCRFQGQEAELAGPHQPHDGVAPEPLHQVGAARDDARGVLGACWNGQRGRRLRELGPSVVARELDFLAPPAGVDGSAPLHYLTGAIDLVYLDSSDGRFVVADFKTDRVAGATEIADRAASYRGQLLAYARALQQAFDLDCLPRAELWFLRADELVVVPEPESRSVGP